MLERVLIVGLGSIGSKHAHIARALLPQAQIAVLRHRGCDQLPIDCIDQCFTSLSEALEFRPQVAVIANPSTLHLKVALPLARIGAHLLIEKPVSSTPLGIQELIDTCKTNGKVLMIAYNLRFMPSLQFFRERLVKGDIGRVLSVRAEIGQYLPAWRPNVDYRHTVSARADLGGGVLLELSHEIDYLRWLFGDVKWVSAVLSIQSELEIDVEDTAHLILGFKTMSDEKPLIASLNMDFFRHDTTRSCVAIGENGTLRWNAISGSVDFFGSGKSSWQTIFEQAPSRDESYLAEWHHFLNCIASGTSPLISGQDGLAVLHIIQAARLSSTNNIVMGIE